MNKQAFIADENIVVCVCYIPQDTSCTTWNTRAESQLSRALLKHALYLSGMDVDIKDIAGGTGVKPYIKGRPELHISLSHCNGLIACAFGRVELGIDAENIRFFDERVMRRVCSREEIDSIKGSSEPNCMFFRCWTLKESYGKAMGVGLAYPMRETAFFDGIKIRSSMGDYTFTLFESIKGYVIALCHKKSINNGGA